MKKSLLAMALAASMTTAALASDQQTPGFANNAFTQTDIQTLFGQDGQHAVQLASLSAQEMQETEGAWTPLIGAAIGGAAGFGGYYIGNHISGRPWSWSSAFRDTAQGAFGGALAGPARMIWAINGAVGWGAYDGVTGRNGW